MKEGAGSLARPSKSGTIAALRLEKFIDPAAGGLREFFSSDWLPAAGVEGAHLRARS
jgi:mannose/cellobiose epimerase-like protein (N-acyl-D-glucosamine 2-epimerase family)